MLDILQALCIAKSERQFNVFADARINLVSYTLSNSRSHLRIRVFHIFSYFSASLTAGLAKGSWTRYIRTKPPYREDPKNTDGGLLAA